MTLEQSEEAEVLETGDLRAGQHSKERGRKKKKRYFLSENSGNRVDQVKLLAIRGSLEGIAKVQEFWGKK